VALTGQVAEVKGIWEYLDAARLLVEKGVKATFAVLGDDLKGHGALRRAMEERVASLALSDHFRFLGFRPDAPRLIPAFDVITVPSHIEPLGNATLEAMAAGRPVVGSRVGAYPEMVVRGETACWCRQQDPTALPSARAAHIAVAVQRPAAGARGPRTDAVRNVQPLRAQRRACTQCTIRCSAAGRRVGCFCRTARRPHACCSLVS
jgi:glycosyltransferase involved in cell wall biosynthesis